MSSSSHLIEISSDTDLDDAMSTSVVVPPVPLAPVLPPLAVDDETEPSESNETAPTHVSQLVISGHFPNFDNLLFTNYYSSITIHHFTIHHFRGQFDILRSVQKFYYSLDTIHSGRNFTIHVHYSFHRKFILRVFKFV